MRNPFRRRSVDELTRAYDARNAKRAAAYRAGKLSPRQERREARALSKLLNKRHKQLRRGK